MKTKTLIVLLCILAIGVGIGATGQYYYSSLPGPASAPSEPGHDHGSERVVHMSPGDIERYGIEIDTAGPGEVDVHVDLPGQIVINSDRVAHIMPTAPGVVRRVFKSVGDTVRAGEVIAWLESSELGKAKVDYLAKWAELGCCSMDLTRAQSIYDSTTELLETLESSPSLEAIRELDYEALDDNHTRLISAYSELVLTRSAYEREKSLYEKKISSEKDFLAAENEFKKANAEYAATRDSIAFNVKRNMLEAQRAQQVREIEVKGAERTLYVLGMNAEDINDIQRFAQGQKADGNVHVCNDPNCPDCVAERAAKAGQPVPATADIENPNTVQIVTPARSLATVDMPQKPDCNCPECMAEWAAEVAKAKEREAIADEVGDVQLLEQESRQPHTRDEKLAWYPLRAPFDATVVEKHITLGEKLDGDSSTFTVADLETVWVDLNVFQKDLPLIKRGQPVTVSVGPAGVKARGTISYVGPLVGEDTRTALARVVLNNTSGELRPGTFITADVLVDKSRAEIVVPKDVVQDVDDHPTVFVWTGQAFEPRTVALGRANSTAVEIALGLSPGEKIVTKNSFRLKAELEKTAGGAHAGHGHAH